MNNSEYQKSLYNKFSTFRPARLDSTYPPYHTGDHLEEYFVKHFQSESSSDRILIPVHWTAVFNHRVTEGLGPGTPNDQIRKQLFKEIECLDKTKSYFTVSTHDDAPQGDFPKNTIHFSAGGNSICNNLVAIPLIGSGLPNIDDTQKMIFCSFVGSTTNPIRNYSLSLLHNKEGYLINAFHWNATVSNEQQNLFYNVMSQSRFSLCPRGYGATSYRLYEAIQMGSIPVYVSDKHLTPWDDVLNWKEFCVVIDQNTIPNIDTILKSMSETQVRKMQTKLKEIYSEFFTIAGTYRQILRRI